MSVEGSKSENNFVGAFEFGVIPGRKLSLTFGLNLTADKSREGQCKNEIIFEITCSLIPSFILLGGVLK